MRFITRASLVAIAAFLLPGVLLSQHIGSAGGRAGARSFTGSGVPAPRVGIAPLGLQGPAAGYTGIRPGALRSSGLYRVGRNNLRNYRYAPYGYFFAPYYYPGLDYASAPYADYGYGYDPSSDPNAQGDAMAQQALGEQVDRLTAEVEQMRSTPYAPYGPAVPPPLAPPDETSQTPQAPPVTLVLRNGQQLRVQNYAIMDQTFWNFSSQPAQKIPIANIDVAASAKATMANGGEFPQLEPGNSGGK